MRSVSAYKDITKLDLPFHMPDASPSTAPRLSEIAPKSVALVVTVGHCCRGDCADDNCKGDYEVMKRAHGSEVGLGCAGLSCAGLG